MKIQIASVVAARQCNLSGRIGCGASPNHDSANLKAGKLLSQLSFAGRKNTDWTVDRMAEFTVFNAKGRSVGGYYIMSALDANQEATKAVPIDATGTYVLRIGVKGPENTNFKLELGGDAIAAR